MSPLALASYHFHKQRYFDAYLIVSERLVTGPEDERECLELAIACLGALDCGAQTEKYLHRLLSLHGSAGDAQGAEATYRQALALVPQSVSIQMRAAQFFMQRQKPGDAEHCLRAALAIDSCLSFAWTRLGELLKASHRENEAFLAFLQAVNIDPTAADAQRQLEDCRQQRGGTP